METILNYNYNDFLQFFKYYLNPEFNTLELFADELLKRYPYIENNEVEILWKAFDVAYEYTIKYGNILKEIKEVKNDPAE